MPNRLVSSTSPYLLQHADNPVEWWEWGEAAFEEAHRRDVPVLLSVGYAACHWCHVMAHESFENPDTAAVMNERFVNVKVDREERPDVDSIYMEAVQAMTGQGGWPMTVWIDHEGRPFHAGTYFPDAPRHGMPSFGQVMEAVSDAWGTRRAEVEDQAARLVSSIGREIPAGDLPTSEMLAAAYQRIESSFDTVNGGFGTAPKFPQQPVLEFLLRIHAEPWAPDAGAMLSKTLEEMAAGGIHDQIGGGFARYSVDSRWLVPHFEKMLYDNAQLIRLYLWAGCEFDRSDFVAVSRSTIAYLQRDLRHPAGGFFSSEDADSEGVEGKFYVWTPDEIRSVLSDAAEPLLAYYGVTEAGNFERANILEVVGDTAPDGLDELRNRLLAARAQRVRPGLDDKVVASWNGLAIRALAEAGAVLGDESYLELARDRGRLRGRQPRREGNPDALVAGGPHLRAGVPRRPRRHGDRAFQALRGNRGRAVVHGGHESHRVLSAFPPPRRWLLQHPRGWEFVGEAAHRSHRQPVTIGKRSRRRSPSIGRPVHGQRCVSGRVRSRIALGGPSRRAVPVDGGPPSGCCTFGGRHT